VNPITVDQVRAALRQRGDDGRPIADPANPDFAERLTEMLNEQIEPRGPGRPSVYGFELLEIGDSKFYPDVSRRVYDAAKSHAKRYGKHFTTRLTDTGRWIPRTA
jgi:hypothetical protein